MAQLKLSDAQARQMYPSAPAEWKQVLEESFGKDYFSQKITDRVKNFVDCITESGISEWHKQQPAETEDEYSYRQIKLIAKVLNEGWTPDWSDDNQYKYYPYFRHKPGFGLSADDYDSWRAGTGAGSRLCFKSAELAEYAGKQFEAIYIKFLSL